MKEKTYGLDSENNLHLYSPTDVPSTNTFNRPLKEIREDEENEKVLIDKMFHKLNGAFGTRYFSNLFEGMNPDNLYIYDSLSESGYIRIPTGAIYIGDDNEIIYNTPSFTLFENQIIEKYGLNADDFENHIEVTYGSYLVDNTYKIYKLYYKYLDGNTYNEITVYGKDATELENNFKGKLGTNIICDERITPTLETTVEYVVNSDENKSVLTKKSDTVSYAYVYLLKESGNWIWNIGANSDESGINIFEITQITEGEKITTTVELLIEAIEDSTIDINNLAFENGTISGSLKTLNIDAATIKINNKETEESNPNIKITDGENSTVIEADGIESDGTIKAETFQTDSARAKKKDIVPSVHKAIEEINNIDIVDFTFKNDATNYRHIGFIADDTDEVFSRDRKHFEIGNCIGMLLKAVQELSEENKQLKEEIAKLK